MEEIRWSNNSSNVNLKSLCRIRKWSRVDLTGIRPGRRSSSLSTPRTPSQSKATWMLTAPRWAILQSVTYFCTKLKCFPFQPNDYFFLLLQLDIHVVFEGEKEFEQKISLWGVSRASHFSLEEQFILKLSFNKPLLSHPPLPAGDWCE